MTTTTPHSIEFPGGTAWLIDYTGDGDPIEINLSAGTYEVVEFLTCEPAAYVPEALFVLDVYGATISVSAADIFPEIEPSEPEPICYRCNGTGREEPENGKFSADCRRCHGTGEN